LAGVGTANAADVDATPLRARKWVIVRMASPQPDKTSWFIQIFATGTLKHAAVLLSKQNQMVSNITRENVLATWAALDPTWTQ